MAKSAYIHIPFCSHKCDFCDFAAFAGLDDLSQEYCDIVIREIHERLSAEPNHEPLETVFFGGGTPGYIDPDLLGNILEALRSATGIVPDAEITMETTPQTVSEEKAALWLRHGINRISIGVESVSDLELKAMGRDHTREQAFRGLSAAAFGGFDNLALDLMYGLPEQTLESWSRTLDELLALSPKHVSAYGLTIAQNSPLLLRYPKDSDSYPDEESFEQMYYMLVEKCARAGLLQYEIANFAVPGYESRHNMTYWKNQEYLAFGVSAHRYYKGRRSSNFRSLKRYMRDYLGLETVEEIDAETALKEAIFLGLRLRKGIDLEELNRKFGLDLAESRASKIEELSELGLLEKDGSALRLTQKGVLISNSVLSELI
ncbi:MAG: radical SAM family heme chaperone HemW [Candidatus Obscuribacterales bacterium]|nr:radical SAM family heme chaperone HemW [Candidatus Obscuribacterales bacterium]